MRECGNAGSTGSNTCKLRETVRALYTIQDVCTPTLKEYCIQAWSPSLRNDIDCLENVQRRATKMVAGLKNLSYVQRLERLNLTTLEERRKRGDLVEMYKLLTEKENVDYQQFFRKEDSQHRLRGHSYKVLMPSVRTTLRKSFFSHRVLDRWNRLPKMVVHTDTVQMFKARHDRFSKDMGN